MRLVVGLLLCSGAVSACSPSSDQQTSEPAVPTNTVSASSGLAVVFEDDFETDPLPRWEPVTQAAWAWERTGRSRVFELEKNVPLPEEVRAPFNRNLVRGVVVADFQVDVDLRSTTRGYPNQSLCLFFGYRDPAHMYYVHFGRRTSDTSNQVFIVDGTDRTSISTKTTAGTPWDDAWHHARVVRDADSGEIEVFFDDMETPVMTAIDTTFTSGQVGIGSFDDTGQFDDVVVRGVRASGQQP